MHKKAFGKLARNFTILSLAGMFLAWFMWFLEVEGDLPLQVRVGPAAALRIAFVMTFVTGVSAMLFVTLRALRPSTSIDGAHSGAGRNSWATEIVELECSLHFYESELDRLTDLDRRTDKDRRQKYRLKAEELRREIRKLHLEGRQSEPASSYDEVN